ncbi:MAG: Toxin RTX-I translocation ATP-binding protein [Chlamydiae bacterium]|nr:Toxin RTX-I translocation ATP-binding protein [Chlamydiota bacterium]
MTEKDIEDSLSELAKVISNKRQVELLMTSDKTDLAHICALIGQAAGFELNPRSLKEATLEEICKKSDLHYRKIFLPQNWWEKDHGPLIGYYQNKPVALLYEKNRYLIVSPTLKQKLAVNAQTGAKIHPDAYMLYPPLPENMGTFRALLHVFFYNKLPDYFFLAIAGALATCVSFFFPLSNKILFDTVIPLFDLTLLGQILLGLIIATAASSMFLLARSFIGLRLNAKISHHLQLSIWDRILKLPVNFFRKMARGDLIQRTLIFDTIRRTLGQQTLIALFDGLFVSLYLIVMFIFSWRLTLVGLGIVTVASLFFLVIASFKVRWDKALLQSNAKINAFLISMITGIDKLRTAGAENQVFARWAKYYSENQRITLKSQFFEAMAKTANQSLSLLSSLLIFAIVIWMRFEDPTVMTIGEYLAFIAAYVPFSLAIFEVLNSGISLISLIPFWQRVQPLLKTPLETTKEKQPSGPISGKITIQNLHFRYSENAPFIFKELNLEIDAGALIAIVGPSGSGKSTLCRLLVGFEIPEKGSIQFDDRDSKELIPNELRQQISFVMQQRAIFAGTLYENILCDGHYSYEEVETALRLTTFDRDIKQFPAGLQTILPSGGGLLSGGERQKLLLSRALIRQPKILILDEGMNSLQSTTQAEIIKAVKSLKMTRILATHQLNILTAVDQIFLFEKDNIVAKGTFDELIKTNRNFSQLIEAQSVTK